jgi:cell wall-associated NlpC family hydrolase
LNSCQGIIGFDCSGLTAYVIVKGGYPSPGGESGTQRSTGTDVSWSQGLPGDIIGFPGHVAVYLGNINGSDYILEASDVGIPIHIVKLTRSDHDASMHRHWSGAIQ